MANIEENLEAIENRFQKGSKQYNAARYIVRQNRKISKDEQEKICQEIPIAEKTLQGLFTELRKMGLYPPRKISDIPSRPSAPEMPKETSHHVPEASQPPLQEYVTKEDFETQFETLRNSTSENLETLKNSVNYLASVIGREAPSNPDELASVMRGEVQSNPGESEEDEDIEVIQPEGMFIQEGSRTKQSIWVKPKTQMYYDMSKEGVFHNYAGTREPGPFADFNGSLSDFFNMIVDDYFIRNYYADIGLTMRRRVR